jgi:hypothetical protein
MRQHLCPPPGVRVEPSRQVVAAEQNGSGLSEVVGVLGRIRTRPVDQRCHLWGDWLVTPHRTGNRDELLEQDRRVGAGGVADQDPQHPGHLVRGGGRVGGDPPRAVGMARSLKGEVDQAAQEWMGEVDHVDLWIGEARLGIEAQDCGAGMDVGDVGMGSFQTQPI